MADEKTKVEDIVIPEVFEQYVIERTAELATFYAGGIVGRDPAFDALAAGPGKTAEMPFWRDISGDRQILHDSNAIETRKIGTSQDTARIHNDANAWSVTLLATLLAGADGMEAIIQLVGAYWARESENMLVATINGVLAAFDAEVGDPNLLKIGSEAASGVSEDSVLTGITFNNARQKLGDQKERLVAIAVHSEVENDLLNQQEIDFIPSADGRSMVKTFKGLRVIMDDDLPKRAGTTDGAVYTSVLFGEGAIGNGNAPLTKPVRNGGGTEGVEFSRVALHSDDVLINRRRMILHPRGVKWNEHSSISDGGPTNAQLQAAARWTRVYEPKNVRIVGIVHNIASAIPAGSS
jgi:hypothetical protein